MKAIKMFFAVCLLGMATSASAQFANASNSSSSASADTEGWKRVTVSYVPMKAVVDIDGADDMKFNGFAVGYAQGFSISNSLPLFVEGGINALFGFNKQDGEDCELNAYYGDNDFEQKTTVFSLSIPVNLVYKFAIPNSDFSIAPFVGVTFRGNIIGKSKYNFIGNLDEWGVDSESELWEEAEARQETNWFDKEEAGSKDAQWKRFQMGWQVGVGVNYKQFHFAASYGKDFMELCKKVKVATPYITLGYNF